nr:THO complex subunit 2 isoform X2 [Ipomoea batatas]
MLLGLCIVFNFNFFFFGVRYHARMLFDRLSPLNPVEHMEICSGLFRLIERSISPGYDLICKTQLLGLPTGGSTNTTDVTDSSGSRPFIDLPTQLFEMLACVGPYLYRDTSLLQKVCRVLRGYYICALELVNSSGDLNSQLTTGGNQTPRIHLKDARLRIEGALGACLLPSLQLIPANPAVGQEIWELLSLLPYEVCLQLASFEIHFVFVSLPNTYLFRFVIVYMVNGRKMMSNFQCFLLQGKQLSWIQEGF